MAVETPHFAHPFQFNTLPNGKKVAACDEQHSPAEVAACVSRIALTPRGFRDELPTFGISDPTFEQQPVDTDLIVSEIGEWEERANLLATGAIDTLDELIAHVTMDVGPENRGENQ